MKQKIIRLTTDKETADFDNYFNDDLVLKKNSKIALLNVKCQIDNKLIAINSSNDNFKYSLNTEDEDAETSVYLTDEDYYNANFQDLIDDLQLRINYSLSAIDTDGEYNLNSLGCECICEIDKDKIIIGFYYPYITELKGQYKSDFNDEFYIYNDGINYDNDNDTFSGEGLLIFNNPLTIGGGIFECILPTQPGDNIIGLTNNITNIKNKSVVNIDDIHIGLYSSIDNGDYVHEIIIDGILDNVKRPYEAGSKIVLYYIQDKIKLLYISNDVVSFEAENIRSINQEKQEQEYLFPVISIENNAQIFNATGTYSTNSFDYLFYAEDIKDEKKFNINKVFTERSFTFPDKIIAREFGFTNLDVNETIYISQEDDDNTAYRTRFISNDFVGLILPSDSFIVELQNINTEYYDAFKSGRKNYIMNFPNQEMSNYDRITYNAIYPIFIDVKSVNDQVLRVIKARILKEDGTKLFVYGTSIITLLIQEED